MTMLRLSFAQQSPFCYAKYIIRFGDEKLMKMLQEDIPKGGPQRCEAFIPSPTLGINKASNEALLYLLGNTSVLEYVDQYNEYDY